MASEMFHFDKFSYVVGNIKVNIRLDRFSRQFWEAQEWLSNTVLADCKAYMPKRTGSMEQRSMTTNHGSEVRFPGPYARMQYGGKVMVGEITKSPWARKGEDKIVTDRPLTYSQPMATDHWFDTAKANHGDYWIAEAKRRAGGG